MTDDDEARHLHNEFDAAIGPTPPAPDRLGALTSRYAAWRRQRAIAAGAGGAAAVAVIVAVALTIAVGPGGGGNNEVASPTAGPTVAPTAIGSAPDTAAPVTPPPSSSSVASATTTPTTVSPSTPPTETASTPGGAAPTNTGQQTTPPAPTLQGTVVNEAGAPLAGIFVTSLHGVTQTDASGHFTAPTQAGHHGGCLLFSSLPITQPQGGPPAGGDYAWQDWQSANCANDVIANIHIVMHPGADVFGTVRDTAGAPVAGVPVFASLGPTPPYYLTSSCCGVYFGETTDAQGNFRIYGLQPNSSTKVSVREPSYRDGTGGIPVPAVAGGGQATVLTDYGEGCDDTFPSPGCPNYWTPSPNG